MPISVYTIEQNEEWDKVVRSYEEYDVYYLSGYLKSFKAHGDGEPLLISYEDEKCRGINVVMKRDIAEAQNFKNKIEKNSGYDLVTPYGYGGWLIEGNIAGSSLFDTYEKWCLENDIISEFVRFHPVIGNQTFSMENYSVIPLGGTIALDLTDPDTIWSNITSKNRNMIRKAQKSGVEIYNGRYPEIFEKFRNIYNGTMDKDNAEAYYYFKPEFYQSIIDDLSEEAQVFYAVFEDKVIAASIMLAANGRLNYHLSGSLMEYQKLAPGNLLLYKAAVWGCKNGCKTFHLGGGVGSQEDSLFKFKKAFYRKDPKQFFIGKKIFDKERYDVLCSMRQIESHADNLTESGFFPEYRQ